MSLDDLVAVNISANTASPTKANFGVMLIAAQKVPAAFTNRVHLFGSLKEMTDFGFAVTDPAYLCAQAMKAQNPSLKSWKVGRRALPCTQTLHLKCTSSTTGDTYTLTVRGTTYTYTVPSSSTTTTVATALAALIAADTNLTVTSATDTITITPAAGAGVIVDVTGWTTNLQMKDATTDPGLGTDLAAIAAEDNGWYGLALDSQSAAEISAAAVYCEANKKLFSPNTSDYGCEDSVSTTDIMYTLKAASYARTGCLYSRSQLLSYSGPAWMSKQFAAAVPGSDTWAYKTLAGITVDTITDGARAAILTKHGNVYVSVSDIPHTEFGMSAAGEWFDQTRFIDWLQAEIQFRVYTALVNNSKIPYTDLGVDMITSIIDSALKQGVQNGGLVKGTTSVSAPKVADIDPATRASRTLNGVTFTGRLAGAIHTLEIDGTVTA